MKAYSLKQLKMMKNISNKDIKKKMCIQTYYNMIYWIWKPTKKTIQKICILFEIDRKEFNRLLKLTLKSNKK